MLVHTDWLLTPQGVAIHVPTATTVVADLHLGYNETRQRGGEAVPLPDIDQLLAPLGTALFRHGAPRLVIAGDLFEASVSAALVEDLLSWLRRSGVDLVGVVPGNHDRRIRQHEAQIPLCNEGVLLGGWCVLHGDGALPSEPVIHGHIHPCLRWGEGVAAPCYLVGPNRLILPAYSRDAAGVSVLRDRRWASWRCCVVVGDRVLDFGEPRHIVTQEQVLARVQAASSPRQNRAASR